MPSSEQADTAPNTRAPGKPCPICGKPSKAATRPFCSKRCAEIDLHRWLSGGYAIAGPALDDAGASAGVSPAEPPESTD